jgi:hypothetical protein
MKLCTAIIGTLILVLISRSASPQVYNGAFSDMFFGPQPSARAEAMGRSIASVPGDPNGYFYNPACLAEVKGLNINGSSALIEPDEPNAMGCAAINIGKRFGTGLSFEQTNSALNIRITAGAVIVEDLTAGINLNIFDADKKQVNDSVSNTIAGTVMYFDIGAMKRFRFDKSKSRDEINVGASLVNLNSAGLESAYGNVKEKLPVIVRAGTSYSRMFWEYFKGIVNVEYEDVLNSKDYQSIHTGIEFGLDPILYLRLGYFAQDVPGEKTHTAVTYGVGVNILLLAYFTGMERGMEPKFELIFDYSRLNLPSFDPVQSGTKKYDLFSGRFTYRF